MIVNHLVGLIEWGEPFLSFHGDTLGQVARLVNVEALLHGDVVGEKL